jgi:hypothetical protein
MLYLVNCEVRKNYYMSDEQDKKEKNHIVEADTEDEAEEKVRKYYESKNILYTFTHYVIINYCNEMIR